jgi:hypothetical protein
MKKLLTIACILLLSSTTLLAQKRLQGKEIGIDLRNFNQQGNISFLVRKATKDSNVLKRRNYSFEWRSTSQNPNFAGNTNDDIPDDFKTNTSSSGFFSFSFGREMYHKLDEFETKDLFLYHALLKNVNFNTSNSKSINPNFDGSNQLSSISRSNNSSASLGFGLSLVGGLKYKVSKKIAIGVESAISAGFSITGSENKGALFTLGNNSTEKFEGNSTSSSSSFIRPQLLNAVWLSYQF